MCKEASYRDRTGKNKGLANMSLKPVLMPSSYRSPGTYLELNKLFQEGEHTPWGTMGPLRACKKGFGHGWVIWGESIEVRFILDRVLS